MKALRGHIYYTKQMKTALKEIIPAVMPFRVKFENQCEVLYVLCPFTFKYIRIGEVKIILDNYKTTKDFEKLLLKGVV